MKQTILTNEERRYFGLNPIEPGWEEVELKDGYFLWFDGDTIKKVISFRDDWRFEYIEQDNEINTRDRQFVLPRTARGKEKKMNFTSVNGMKATGCVFSLNLMYKYEWDETPRNSLVQSYNLRNSLSLPITDAESLQTLSDFRTWLSEYIATCPSDYFEKVEQMKDKPHETVKYYNGDIFRFELDREHYGFGLIIGQIRKMEKDGVLGKEHIMHNVMGVPLWVRIYYLKTKDKNTPVDEISRHPLMKAFCMADNSIIWGSYELVGSKLLTAEDIDFPIQAGESIDAQNPNHVRLCWGVGSIVLPRKGDLPEEIENNQLMRHGVSFGININKVEKFLEKGAHLGENVLIRDLEKKAFDYFGLPENTTFDDFNTKHGGMTRSQYADYANRTGRSKPSAAK